MSLPRQIAAGHDRWSLHSWKAVADALGFARSLCDLRRGRRDRPPTLLGATTRARSAGTRARVEIPPFNYELESAAQICRSLAIRHRSASQVLRCIGSAQVIIPRCRPSACILFMREDSSRILVGFETKFVVEQAGQFVAARRRCADGFVCPTIHYAFELEYSLGE